MSRRAKVAGVVVSAALVAVGVVIAIPTSGEQAEVPVTQTSPDAEEAFRAKQPTHVQAVVRYFDAYNEALHTGEVEPYLALTTGDCATCAKSAKRIRSVFENGGRFESAELRRVADRKPEVRRDGNTAFVAMTYRSGPWEEYPGEDARPERHPERITTMQVKLVRRDGGWKIAEIYATDGESSKR